LVFEPRIIFPPCIIVLWALPIVLGRIRQAKIFELFRKTSAIVPPIHLRSPFGVPLQPLIKFELRRHHVKVPALQHWPIYQPLILRGMCASSPIPKIRREGECTIYSGRIIGEQPSIKLRRVLPIGITRQHVAKELIIPPDTPSFLFLILILRKDSDIAPFPKCAPPGLRLFFPHS